MDIKFKDTSKLIMAICSSILKDENKTLIVSTDEEKSKITSTRKSVWIMIIELSLKMVAQLNL